MMGGLFVIETLSVILQVGYFKYTHGKRLFRMAPLHHHFELKGWSEPKDYCQILDYYGCICVMRIGYFKTSIDKVHS